MTVYVDTSALLAILDADDANHGPASEVWRDLLADGLVLSEFLSVPTTEWQ